METFSVVVTGQVLPGYRRERVLEQLAELFHQSTDTLARLFDGHPKPIKRQVDAATAERYVDRLRKIGVECRSELDSFELDADAVARTHGPIARVSAPRVSAHASGSIATPARRSQSRSMVFCRACGKEIRNSAQSCPHCGAIQGSASDKGTSSFSSYEQVPWYRKNWFAILCALLFTPALAAVLLTGDVYYERKGQLRTYSKGAKIFLIVWSILWLAFAVAEYFGEG